MAYTASWDCSLSLTLCPSPSACCSLGLVSLIQKSALCIYVPGTVRGAGNITTDNQETDPLLREVISLWEEQIINKEINKAALNYFLGQRTLSLHVAGSQLKCHFFRGLSWSPCLKEISLVFYSFSFALLSASYLVCFLGLDQFHYKFIE